MSRPPYVELAARVFAAIVCLCVTMFVFTIGMGYVVNPMSGYDAPILFIGTFVVIGLAMPATIGVFVLYDRRK